MILMEWPAGQTIIHDIKEINPGIEQTTKLELAITDHETGLTRRYNMMPVSQEDQDKTDQDQLDQDKTDQGQADQDQADILVAESEKIDDGSGLH